MEGRHGFASITLTPGALIEAAWSPSRGENRGAGTVQKKRYLCDKDGGFQGDLSLGEWLRTSRMMERWMLRPSLHVRCISRIMPAGS